MEIIGIGTDITDIRRIKKVLDQYKMHFLMKIFSQTEIKLIEKKNFDVSFIAKRWAGKESAIKAMNKSISWHDIEITNEISGKPLLKILNQPKLQTFISLTDEFPYAQAYVIITKNN